LVASNVFMILAWYAHLKEFSAKPWWIAALASWGIALLSTCCRCRRARMVHRDVAAAAKRSCRR
jgi:uncharacterized protein (DUF486 family)